MPAGSKDDILSAEDLAVGWSQLKKYRPNILSELDFDLENTCESLRWLQFMWQDCKAHAHGIAVAISALVSYRCLGPSGTFQDFWYTPNLKYDMGAYIQPQLERLRDLGVSREVIQMKIGECQSALAWLAPMAKSSEGGRIMCSWHVAYKVLSDSLCHLHCYERSIISEDCRLACQ